jgi:hypothetical protein
MPIAPRALVRATAAAILASVPLTACAAGVFTYAPFTGDADSGILPTNTYSHAIDFAAPAGAILVNGLRFNDDDDLITGQPSYSLIGVPNGHLGTPNPNNLVGDIATVVQAFRYGATDNGQATFVLKGLRPGASYVTTFYTRGWDTPPRNINLTTSDGGSLSFNEDGFGQGNGGKLTYAFTAADRSLQFNFVPAVAGTTFHFYGMTNQIAAGSPFTARPVTGDADSGVLPAGNYTHAVDLNGTGGTVNGVNFVGGGTSGNGGFGNNYSITGATNAFSNDTTNVTGSLGSMLTNFFYGHTGGVSKLTLEGLNPGQNYEFTLFSSGFGPAGGRFVTISDETGSIVYDANFTGDDNGNALSYVYTATGTTETFNFDPHNTNDTLHLYAFANRQVPVPEPTSLALVALSSFLFRRRSRR